MIRFVLSIKIGAVRTVAITGASGFIGGYLVQAFRDAGWCVLGLCRDPGRHSPVEGVTYRRFELEGELRGLLDGVDVLVHCAFEPYRKHGTTNASARNVEGSRSLFRAARQQGVGSIVYLSSFAVYRRVLTAYARDKLAVEELLDNASDIAVRPALVVGDGGLFASMYRFVRKRRVAPLFFGGRNLVHIVGADDLAGSIVQLVESNRRGAFVLAAREPISMKAMYEKIAEKARTRVFLIPLPYAPVLFAVRLLERLGLSLAISSGNLEGLGELSPVDIPASEIPNIEMQPFPIVLGRLHVADS